MNPKLTPRTDIDGAHQQGVFVRSGSKLGRSFYEYKRIYFVVVCGLLTAMAMNSSSEYWSNYAHAGQELPLWLNVGLISLIVVGLVFMVKSHPYVQFAYNCFIKPFLKSTTSGINANEHQARLEQFYSGQAQIYDETRKRLLKGRSTMLKLCAAQLRQVYPCQIPFVNGDRFGISNYNASPSLSPTFLSCAGKRFAWVDVGGGTGENIERMNQFFPISNFERVYLVDITPSLCDIARKRFQRLGWSNVKVVCVDASKFKIPKEDGDDLDIALVTMSYSLTMIESFYPVIDQLQKLLAPTGIFGVADFYCPTKRSADPTRQISWLMRWFWAIWFDLDNVYLSPGRREYLEHKFKTVKQISKMNPFIKPFVKIPYYVWIGAQKVPLPSISDGFSLDTKADNVFNSENSTIIDSETLSDEEERMEPKSTLKTSLYHVSNDHVHGQGYRWREHFDPSLLDRFSTYLYAFTWEDPRVDLQFLELTPKDRMLVITSGGCNVLEYAIKVGPQRIHAVDLNPCQNHLLELKLAGLTSLCYEDFWKLFGEGYIPNFRTILDTLLSPNLSPYAYEFWKRTGDFKNLFKTGCSGLAIKVFNFVIKLRRLQPIVEQMCATTSLEEQNRIWKDELRPHLLNKWLIRILNNDRFLWGALGVPQAQMQMLLEEGSAHTYVVNTFDPVIENSLLSMDNYFFYMPLMLKYKYEAPGNPAYLTQQGFKTLADHPERLDAIKIHTDYIVNVLAGLNDGELTKVILMDHLDWFSVQDAQNEINAVHKKMATGGYVFWRSAGKAPWYNELFEKVGFKIICCQVREGETLFIDRVNMYASFWKGIKL